MGSGVARRDPNLTEKLAACLILLGFVKREAAKEMTAGEIVALAGEWDHHPIPYAVARDLGMTPEQYNHPTNIDPKPPAVHKTKTKDDVTRIAKGKRITKEHEAFQRRLLAKSQPDTPEKPKKKYQWASRKMQSRNTLKR